MEKTSLFILLVLEAILMLLLVDKKSFLKRKNSYLLISLFLVVLILRLISNTYWSTLLILVTSVSYFVLQAFYLSDWLFAVTLFLYRNTVVLITFFSLELLENGCVFLHLKDSVPLFGVKLVLQSLCCGIMILLYKKWIIKTNQWATQVSNRYTIILSILSLLLQLGTVILIFHYYQSDQWFKLTYSIIMYHFLLFVTILISFFLNVVNEKTQELTLIKKQANLQEKQYHLVRESIHDQRAILLGLEAMIKKQDFEAVEKMLCDILNSFGELLKEDNYQKILSIPQPAIQSIFLDFLKKVQMNNIQLKLEVIQPPQTVSIGLIDFLRCASILLNNAIENNDGEIIVFLKGTGNGIELKVINSYSGKVRLADIYQKNYTTHEDHSGLGLFILNRIVSQYKNVFFEVSQRDSMFEAVLTIT